MSEVPGRFDPLRHANEVRIEVARVVYPDDTDPADVIQVTLEGLRAPLESDDLMRLVRDEGSPYPAPFVISRQLTSFSWGASNVYELITVAVSDALTAAAIERALDFLVEKYVERVSDQYLLTADQALETALQSILLKRTDLARRQLEVLSEADNGDSTYTFEIRSPADTYTVTVGHVRHIAVVIRVKRTVASSAASDSAAE